MRNFYMIDLENVGKYALTGIERLDETDRVYIFYSSGCDSITDGIRQDIEQSKAKIEGRVVKATGKNALDFQLITMLGRMSMLDECERISVITKDGGFESAILFLVKEDTRFQHHIERYPTLWDARIDEERALAPAESAKRKQKCNLTEVLEKIEKASSALSNDKPDQKVS